MSDIKASVKFDMAKPAVAASEGKPAQAATPDSATVTLELVGASEMEHELLAQFFKARNVSLVPFHVGDELECRFVIADDGAFARAQRATENRIRTRNGQPTVEQEEERKANQAKAQALRDKQEADAKAAGFASFAEMQEVQASEARENKLADKVAARLAAAKEIAVDPKAPKQ